MNLPENYIVICETREETNSVMNSLNKYKDKSERYWLHWNYVCIISNNDNIFNDLECVENWFKNKNILDYKTFTFKEWKQMKENKTFPKYWFIKITEETLDAVNKVRAKQKEYNRFLKLRDYTYYGTNKEEIVCGFGELHVHKKAIELTLEEFKSYFLKEESITKQQFNKMKLTVFVNEVLKIHKIACSSWKTKIATYLTRVDSNQNITFTQLEVDEMFKAATSDQKPVLTKIFGESVKPIEWDKIKTGSKVMLQQANDQQIGGNNNVDYNKPFDVVFWKTSHSIDCENRFNKGGAYEINSTFHQNEKYIRFDAGVHTNYITEVIEY